MRKRKYLKKIALFLALAVALNTSSLSVRALAEENDEEVQEISVEQPDKQIMDGQEQEKVESVQVSSFFEMESRLCCLMRTRRVHSQRQSF